MVSNDLLIGTSSAGLGTAIDKFQTVGGSISVEDKRINTQGTLMTTDRVITPTDKKTVQLFGPLKIPGNSTAVFAYQLGIAEIDDDDNPENDPNFEEIDLNSLIERDQEAEKERRGGINSQDRQGIGDVEVDEPDGGGSNSDLDDNVLIYGIDNLKEGNNYPIQANEDYRSTGLIQYLDVISEDDLLATVIDVGVISPSYSYGVAEIETTQKQW